MPLPIRKVKRRAHVGPATSTSYPVLNLYASPTSQDVTLPEIPELFDENFLDILLPPRPESPPAPQAQVKEKASNPLLDALLSTSHRTWTEKGAPAYSSTLSPTLDAFNGLTRDKEGSQIAPLLDAAWKEDPNLTLRMIWNIRSIHDGKNDKETFYRAFGWLLERHPRTAIANLPLLVQPVCKSRKGDRSHPHGFWKDLLNILCLATTEELFTGPFRFEFLHAPRAPCLSGQAKAQRKMDLAKVGVENYNAKMEFIAQEKRASRYRESHTRLLKKLSVPHYRALYVAVARLFTEHLVKDLNILAQASISTSPEARSALLRQLTLVGKWAPSPAEAHDRITNIATAISLLLYSSAPSFSAIYPSVMSQPLQERDKALLLRSFYQRWVLTELRRATLIPEPLMCANRWSEIRYNRVPSVCMKRNNQHFARHDPEGFEKYLLAVESGKKRISGATLLPHELVGEIIKLNQDIAGATRPNGRFPTLKQVKAKMAETQLRVVEGQWRTLIERLRESGSIENSIAICDVSGSMGSILNSRTTDPSPILPAVSLSLVLASLAKPPFDSCFITFSEHPSIVRLDLTQPLNTTVKSMENSNWGMTTNLNAVFCELILPLAVKNKVLREDMIKRVFIFSDMQFDEARAGYQHRSKWETNYDIIAQEYAKHGYDVPEIIYWDLADGYHTVEVQSDTKGVAMMNGFSPSMLKVFMGEESDDSMDPQPDKPAAPQVKEVMTPISVMRKALLKDSFDGLVVID
ncbi:hypothetical protein NLJ89_g4597 [Agrocybe chaxingu]|uniref:Uncharacterized protein n=1 Tax=Agrocybe chaxingu TaxID=84603 RepID=A0A9W8K9H4_9AGAR|nr:hypothetical protein NLJ89_g4597 [Agrocybe chaxingu]